MKILFAFIIFSCLLSPAFSQEDSVKTAHEKFFQPVIQTEAPEEVTTRQDVPAPSSTTAPKVEIEPKKIRNKKSGAKKE
ncbi:MAG: hypothetical protein EOO10_22965 [Chitinophagaceae bacterium]|nr:MAG: hypothetical protein EOO10_22965 [Chitinophagaceae bacterium]